MNIGRLAQDELAYEMRVRGLRVDTVEVMRKALRSSRLLERRGSMDNSKSYPFSFNEDCVAVRAKIEEIKSLLKDPPKNPKSSEYVKILTKIEWSIGRIGKAVCEDDDNEEEQSALKNELLILLGVLMGDSCDSDREVESPKKKSAQRVLTLPVGGSVSVSPAGVSDVGQVVVRATECNRNLGFEAVLSDVRRSVTDLDGERGSLGFGNSVSRVDNLRMSERCLERVGKWGVKFSGESDGLSVNAFLERVEELRVANDVPQTHLYKSATELLIGKALVWFRTVREDVSSWQELVKEIKAEFLPANYDDLLLEEINRRSQGKDETFGGYLAVMRTLFRRLSEPLSEGRMLSILKKNVDPFFQKQIASAKPNTVN